MQNITSVSELKNAIEFLKEQQTAKGLVVKEQFHLVLNGFKPLNLLAGTLNDISRSPLLVENLIGISMGLLTGTMSKSLFVGASGSKFKGILGTIMQYGITNFVANKTGFLKSVGTSILKSVVGRKAKNTEIQ